MTLWLNIRRGEGLPENAAIAAGEMSADVNAVLSLLAQCPAAKETPLIPLPMELLQTWGVGEVWIKDERERMNLGSFKALGAAYVIAKQAAAKQAENPDTSIRNALDGVIFCSASAGNHGLSLAAGAKLFGASAVVFLSNSVSQSFAERLKEKGATVIRAGENYEESLTAALQQSETEGWTLLSDTSWPGYTDLPRDVMEGYLAMGAEAAAQIHKPPTHIFLQAGVGGMAAACAVTARKYWDAAPKIIVVEPEYAPALLESVRAGRPLVVAGPVSNMGRLDCKEPSHLALTYLAREADAFQTVGDDEVASFVAGLSKHGLASSPSGAAGLAALALLGVAEREQLNINARSRVLVYLSEKDD